MPLIQPFAIKTQLGNTDLELKADPGESFLVKDIMTHYVDSDYCTVRIDKSTVGYFRQNGDLGGHIFRLANWNKHSHDMRGHMDVLGTADKSFNLYNCLNAATGLKFDVDNETGASGQVTIDEAVRFTTGGRSETLLQYLNKRMFKGWPVAEGETFKLSGVAKQDATKQVVVYEIYEGGDMKSDMENGSKSGSYMFLNYGNCGAAVNKNGDTLYTTSVSPAEFQAFPFGSVVPAKHEIEILGICGSPVAPKENTSAHYIFPQFLKLIKDREVLFDEDRQGILFENRQGDRSNQSDSIAQGFSLIGGKTEFDLNDPFMFDPPLKFGAGDELGIYLTTVVTGDGQEISQALHEICLIERVTRIE